MPNESRNLALFVENIFKTKIDKRGRIYVPRHIRKRFSIKLGERLYIKLENSHFSIYTARTIDNA